MNVSELYCSKNKNEDFSGFYRDYLKELGATIPPKKEKSPEEPKSEPKPAAESSPAHEEPMEAEPEEEVLEVWIYAKKKMKLPIRSQKEFI